MSEYGWYRLSARHKWHKVESVINDDHVTYCGRRLSARPGDEIAGTEPLTRLIGQPQLCKVCA